MLKYERHARRCVERSAIWRGRTVKHWQLSMATRTFLVLAVVLATGLSKHQHRL